MKKNQRISRATKDETRVFGITPEAYDMVTSFMDVYVNEVRFGRKITPGELITYCVWELFQEEDIPKVWEVSLWERGTFKRYENQFGEMWPGVAP